MKRAARLALAATAAILAGCRQDMERQPKLLPDSATAAFPDGRSDRPRLAGTVARGDAAYDAALAKPPPIDAALLTRGRERFGIFCAPCHGAVGDGHGMVAERGFPRPPSFHEPRLVAAPAEHFLDVITNGYGVMYSYAARVPPADRWAIVAYIRALQLSQNAALARQAAR